MDEHLLPKYTSLSLDSNLVAGSFAICKHFMIHSEALDKIGLFE